MPGRCAYCADVLDSTTWDACSQQCGDELYELYTLEAAEQGWNLLPDREQDELMEDWYIKREKAVDLKR